jgi:hypothetical protein
MVSIAPASLIAQFSLKSSGPISVVQGSSGTSTISITPNPGFAAVVTLKAGNLPTDASSTFTPPTASSPYSTGLVLTITTKSSTPTGTSTLTITGTAGDGSSQTASVSLTVTAPKPEIDTVTVFSQANPTAQNATAAAAPAQSSFVLEVVGKNFVGIDPKTVQVIPLPASGVSGLAVSSISSDGTKIFAEFTAPSTYVLNQVALSISGSTFLSFDTGAVGCDFAKNVSVTPQLIPEGQSKTKFGNGIGTNFFEIQVSIVNKCPMPIDIPLAGIMVEANDEGSLKAAQAGAQNSGTSGTSKSNHCATNNFTNLTPVSLAHLTSLYSEDRQLTGARAVYFNALQAAATLGSAIEPFFGHGFTQAVAILGGGFTTASKQIFVDMSAQQLQDITAQSFSPLEQVASGGSDQKSVFIPVMHKCRTDTLATTIRKGDFTMHYQLIPASGQAPSQQQAQGQKVSGANASNSAAPN